METVSCGLKKKRMTTRHLIHVGLLELDIKTTKKESHHKTTKRPALRQHSSGTTQALTAILHLLQKLRPSLKVTQVWRWQVENFCSDTLSVSYWFFQTDIRRACSFSPLLFLSLLCIIVNPFCVFHHTPHTLHCSLAILLHDKCLYFHHLLDHQLYLPLQHRVPELSAHN